MGIEDVLLNMDMGWTDTAHHQPHRTTQFLVNNITTLSSLIAAPTQLLQRGAMASFGHSAPFLEFFRSCGFLTLGRVLSELLERPGKFGARVPVLLRPYFWTFVLLTSLKVLFVELWFCLYAAQNYPGEDGEIRWAVIWQDLWRWSKRDGPAVVGKVLFPIWVMVGYLVIAFKVSGWSILGSSPSSLLVCSVVVFGGVLGGWWFISDYGEEEKRRSGLNVHFDGELDSAETTSDEGKALGKGMVAGAKRRPKGRKPPKKKKNSTRF